jgi:hypothetical protein
VTERERLARGTFSIIPLGPGIVSARTVSRDVDENGVTHTHITDRQLGEVRSLSVTLAEYVPTPIQIVGRALPPRV